MLTKQELIAKTLHEIQGNISRVLDVGYAQHPNPHLGGEVHGIDIVELPLPAGYASVKRCDLNIGPIPFQEQYFDAVTMGCTLAHVANPVRLLEDINRVLKTGGYCVLSSPNPHYYWEWVINVFFNVFSKRVSKAKFEEHFTSFSRYNMRTISHRTGFRVEREVGCSFQLVKTNFRMNPERFPGMAYEIIYVLKKIGKGELYTTYEGPQGIERIPTTF